MTKYLVENAGGYAQVYGEFSTVEADFYSTDYGVLTFYRFQDFAREKVLLSMAPGTWLTVTESAD